MRQGIIYRSTSASGKQYVGKTVYSLERRIYQHLVYANRIRGDRSFYSDSKFSKAIRKYGSGLLWEILYDKVPLLYLDHMERFAICMHSTYTKGYNSTPGGDGLPVGTVLSEVVRQRMSNSKVGNKNAVGNSNRRGAVISQVTREKMSAAKRGNKNAQGHRYQCSAETRKKLSDAKIGNTYAAGTRKSK